jgi:hypothetical protein
MKSNPFDITKAVDYTDDQIYQYWVDMDGQNFMPVMKPESLMPVIIVGSKGSGKTHIMKFYSYELQKIRCRATNKSLAEGLTKEKFIGVYIRCSGFNASKFSGRGVADELWQDIYSYFWELWIGERIINIIIDLKNEGLIKMIAEQDIVNSIKLLFLKEIDGVNSFDELRNYLISLQKKVEYQVQNFMFLNQKKPNVDILLPPNRITYGIPTLLKEKIPFFKDKYIMYLIDELENFSENQQELIQTLLREKPVACTFRIGTRPYGIRTFKTMGGVEENHDGSEFEMKILDEELRNYDKYQEYVILICENRLHNSELSIPQNTKLSDLIDRESVNDIINKVYLKKEVQSQAYLYRLQKNLAITIYGLSQTDIEQIINNIKFKEDRIIERTNVVLMYRRLKEKRRLNLIKESEDIRKSALEYFETPKRVNTEHFTYLDKYRQDIIDTIAREGRVPIPYNGIDRLIELSCGTPRTILRLLKASFNTQYFNTGKIPFENGNKLTIKAQKYGIENTYEWFFEENRIPSSNLCSAVESVYRLGNYLQRLRFSDLPPQCSINIFSLSIDDLSDTAKEVFNLLLKYSYVVKSEERRMKNSDNKTTVYRLNSILLPKWELSLSKRGLVQISGKEAELIFNIAKKNEFEEYCKIKMKSYNFPFTQSFSNQNSLFDN